MGLALRTTKDREVSEEIVHDTFVKVWKSIDDYDSDKGRLFTWMSRICKNCAYDHVKSKRAKNSARTDTIGDTLPLGERWTTQSMNVETIGVKEWIDALPQNQRAVVDAIYFQGMTHSEASEELEMPLGTVKTRLRMGLIALRKKLGI